MASDSLRRGHLPPGQQRNAAADLRAMPCADGGPAASAPRLDVARQGIQRRRVDSLARWIASSGRSASSAAARRRARKRAKKGKGRRTPVAWAGVLRPAGLPGEVLQQRASGGGYTTERHQPPTFLMTAYAARRRASASS